jgi:hypothetical protein
MKVLLKYYEDELKASNFYSLLNQKLQLSPSEYNSRLNLIEEQIAVKNPENALISDKEALEVKNGDLRIDMPILLGNTNAKQRILVLGLEPRHTNNFYNIMKNGKKVFATPFGIDRWFSKSKQSVYGSAFDKFLTPDRLFLFSDFVKEYKVIDSTVKSKNDQEARQNFKMLFDRNYKSMLEEEIEIFKPTLVIGLGKTDISKKIPKIWLDKFNVNVISHPTNGNFNRMQVAMKEILGNKAQ